MHMQWLYHTFAQAYEQWQLLCNLELQAAELQLLCNMLQHSTGTHIGVCQPVLLSAYRAIATAHSSTS